jgi:hypothetical protein
MKYCKICKTAAKDTDTVCAKGHPLSVFGAKPATGVVAGGGTATPGPATGAAMFTLQGQLRELEQARRRNVNFGRGLGLLSLLLLLAILAILYQVYARSVLDYAVVENIRFEQDPVAEHRITVRFDVKEPGKVVFDRRSGSGRTEKLDLLTKTEPYSTDWAWPSDRKTGIDFRVVYRNGWFRTFDEKHFDVTRDRLGVEVVFLMDVTSSMGPFIEGLKRNCREFADRIRERGVDCQLGLIGFGDVDIGEPISTFDPTADVAAFQEEVSRLDLTNGGDEPESSAEAIEKALEMRFRPHTRVCFVHITDADCKHVDRIPSLAASLKERGIVTYVISRGQYQWRYRPLCVNGGDFLGLGEARFEEILAKVAKSLANQINSQ